MTLGNRDQAIQTISQLLILLNTAQADIFFPHHIRRPSEHLSHITVSFIAATKLNPQTVMILGLTAVSHSSLSKLCANLIGKYIQMEIFDSTLSSLLSFNADGVHKDI